MIERIDYPRTDLLINGTWRPPTGGRYAAVLNPATGAEIGSVAIASREDLIEVAECVLSGLKTWNGMPLLKRYAIMRDAAQNLRSRVDLIAPLLTLEQGKPLLEAKAELNAGADVIEWFSDEMRRAYGRTIPSRLSGVLNMTISRAVGPVAAFTPWNFPINQVVRKISVALAAGCSIVVKGPEETPAAPAELIKAFLDAGVPAGALNLIFGVPSEVSEFLIPHPNIKKISFTGSTAVGKHLASLAGRHMKLSTMELGGHAPAIILDDADVPRAISVLATGKYRNAGQVCVAPTRFLVQEGTYANFVDQFVAFARNINVGNGLDPSTTMGPLIHERRRAAVEELITDSVARGAKVLHGGKRVGNEGFFFEPTVLADVPQDARIMNEEPFGPVAIMQSVRTIDDAIDEANRLPFGLASYAFTSSLASSHEMANRIEAGMTSINYNGIALPELPFGGINDSGYGSEGGYNAIESYLHTKLVTQAANW
ncbi:NAD-dependent succinate-semialdehyde dehydrogenase [Mesorhizobium denitrificans]|uniref:NAD-dependent succinate-semialdehyde dehydrogenase n=1 Tax=Mesorhizobium denitrificans TaxID=2294114 RepID=A0A371X9F7_9HYPH|nr:NAD-dependent succinate-semialdehyde dehydrogenase [Mesorhizobium denitrificans]RFC65887.1 NAD-dependent succinate-semialdehyde dehydrogenase [Mesorhizobium denitrificans]